MSSSQELLRFFMYLEHIFIEADVEGKAFFMRILFPG
jgi:hypothetical protein